NSTRQLVIAVLPAVIVYLPSQPVPQSWTLVNTAVSPAALATLGETSTPVRPRARVDAPSRRRRARTCFMTGSRGSCVIARCRGLGKTAPCLLSRPIFRRCLVHGEP